jgi:predicted metalloprotease with PDZ domain
MNAYTFQVREPEARRIEVELSVEPRGARALDVRMPVWTPGSYLVREHQRHVDGLHALDGDRELAVTKIDKQTWRIDSTGADRIRIAYRLHCFELTVRTNHVDATHAFVNPSAAAVYVVGRENEPCSVQLTLPAGWRAWVALPVRDGAYQAHDFDELADSPFEMGPDSTHQSHLFTAGGVEHELVVWGKGDFEAGKAVPDMVKIVDTQAALFGGLPYGDRYLFILHLNDKGRGGLEHRRSCALIVPRFSFAQKSAYEDFLLLVAHEFFHLWNVKRLRPQAFTPYDWTRENHTRLLWAMEGLTSTYEVMTLRRAGLVPPQRFLEIWAERITQLLRTPGRLRTTLAQASFDAWIKHYRPDESTANTTVSYYLKGSIVGFLLDLELRRRTAGLRSLDDLMRALYERFGRAPGLPEDGVEKTAVEVSRDPLLQGWLDRALRSTQELPIEDALRGVGMLAIQRAATAADDKGGAESNPKPAAEQAPQQRAWFGATLREKAGALEVTSVVDGSPAQRSGIAAGDEIVALDSFRGDLKQRIGRAQGDQMVRLSLFRMEELFEVPVQLVPAPRDAFVFVPDPDAPAAAVALREQWLAGKWPEE